MRMIRLHRREYIEPAWENVPIYINPAHIVSIRQPLDMEKLAEGAELVVAHRSTLCVVESVEEVLTAIGHSTKAEQP